MGELLATAHENGGNNASHVRMALDAPATAAACCDAPYLKPARLNRAAVHYTENPRLNYHAYKIVGMAEVVPNWEAIVHKNARTSDHIDAGNVIEIEEDTITLERGPTAEFVIPKSKVEGFDGSEVVLSLSFKELGQYRRK